MSDNRSPDVYPFPGRWLGGSCLIFGPLLLLTGALLRIQFHFFAPQQLEAYAAHPLLVTAAYSTYSIGSVVLCFGVLLLVHRIAEWNRTWAFWGGALALIGFFNRTFSAGVDHMVFQMVNVLGPEQAFTVVSDTYKAFHVFRYTNGALMLSWPVLAIGAFRAGILGPLRAAGLALMVMLPMGTLKGTEVRSIAIVGLCSALVPLGVSILRDGPPLGRRAKIWIVVLAVYNAVSIVLTVIFPDMIER